MTFLVFSISNLGCHLIWVILTIQTNKSGFLFALNRGSTGDVYDGDDSEHLARRGIRWALSDETLHFCGVDSLPISLTTTETVKPRTETTDLRVHSCNNISHLCFCSLKRRDDGNYTSFIHSSFECFFFQGSSSYSRYRRDCGLFVDFEAS